MNTNLVVLIGNLTKAPELRYTNNNKAVAKFSIAVNGYKEDDVSFVPVQVWGKQAENCEKYLSKGKKVAVSGNLKQDRWETDRGDKRSRIIVNAQSVEFLSPKEEHKQEEYIDEEVVEDYDEGSEDIPF